MADLDQWEACKKLAEMTDEMYPEWAAYVIQEFISRVDDGESHRMALSLAKKVKQEWDPVQAKWLNKEIEKHINRLEGIDIL